MWFGAKINNVIGMGEISAAGLPSETGVRLEEVPNTSEAAKAGVKVNDVILTCGGRATASLADFERAWALVSVRSPVRLEVWRDQRLQPIDVRVAPR